MFVMAGVLYQMASIATESNRIVLVQILLQSKARRAPDLTGSVGPRRLAHAPESSHRWMSRTPLGGHLSGSLSGFSRCAGREAKPDYDHVLHCAVLPRLPLPAVVRR